MSGKTMQQMASGSQDDPDMTARAARNAAQDTRTVELSANRIDSKHLFAASREIMIAHGDDIYRLRLTSQNKLILTK